MSHLVTKANVNKAAGKLLLEKGMYCSVIHCEYYSCLQQILVKLNKFGYDENTINTERQTQTQRAKRPIGHHECIINITIEHLKTKLRYEEVRKFNEDINTLKQLRVKSDYQDVTIFRNDADDSISLEQKITLFLDKHL